MREECEADEVFPEDIPMHRIFDQSFARFVPTLLEGVNISLLLFGASGSGKTHSMTGSPGDAGLVQLFSDALFPELESKRLQLQHGQYRASPGQSAELSYRVRARFVEVVGEELTDLLSSSSAFGHNALTVIVDEWEGPGVEGVEWQSVSSAGALNDLFTRGTRNRTKRSNEFGKISDKAAAVLTVAIEQKLLYQGVSEPTLLYSTLTVVELPGSEALGEEEKALAVRQGSRTNQAIFAVDKILSHLSSSKHGDFAYYEASQLTQLLVDALGGNSVTVALFTLANGDPTGSLITLRALQRAQKVRNYPLVNDSRVLGLLRKYRMILMTAQARGGAGGGALTGDASELQQQVAELERKLIQYDMDKIRVQEEKRGLVARLTDMRDKFNAMVEEKAGMQGALIDSEEEKLKISKAIIELQIEYSRLEEQLQQSRFEADSKVLHAESSLVERGVKEEKAAQAIGDLQEKVQKLLEEKKEMEVEYVALRKNYLTVKEDADKQRTQAELMQVEILNLVN